MRLHINHKTRYQYDVPVTLALQQVRLTPKARPELEVINWNIDVEGGKKELEFTDQHGNHVDLISVNRGAQELTVHVKGEVEVSNNAGIVGQHWGYMALWTFLRPTSLTQAGPKISALLTEMGSDFSSDIERAHALSELILRHVPYEIGRTDAETNAEQAVEAGAGVCQDHAHIFISAMRKLGHPARYVSGYLMMNDREEQDATHAWAEAHLDGIGWVGFDVSNGYSPDERYVRVATGLDYKDAAPVSGMRYGGASENMVVQLQVQQ